MNNKVIYIGIGGSVLALNPETGEEIWRKKLKKGATMTTVTRTQGRLLAASSGELWALNPETGEILWHNKLKKLGYGFVSIAGESSEDGAVAEAETEAAVIVTTMA